MRKYILGFIVGAVIMSATQAYGGAITLIGKEIKKEVVVNILGKQLLNKAPLIDGVTYVPIREVTESLGLKAVFVNGEVEITNLSKTDLLIKSKTEEIDGVKDQIESNNKLISEFEKQIIDETGKTDYLTGLSPTDQLERRKKVAVQLIDQLTALNQELAELEAQKAELEAQQ